MLNNAQMLQLKKDADDTLKKINMTNYNKDMFLLIGASLAIKNNDLTDTPDEQIEQKKNNFDNYYKQAMQKLKEAMSFYDIAEKIAYTPDDMQKLQMFREYLGIILQKKQG